jgi:aminoglycoside 2'-N-acetyltransferase I
MKIEIKAASKITSQEGARLNKLLAEALPPEEDDIKWSEQSDWHVLVWDGEELVSNVEIIERTATVDGKPVSLGGIGGVATGVEWRRRGLASAALETAQTFICEKLAVDFGLLFCSEDMIPFYGRFGWQILERPVLVDQPGGKVAFTEAVMILPVGKNEWPEGVIDLCGLPF